MSKRVYFIDASSLIFAASEHYPIENFPAFWKRMADLVEASRLLAPEEVVLEVLRKADTPLAAWVKQQASLKHPIDDAQQTVVSEILAHAVHKKLVDTSAGRGAGDPWVIAAAEAVGGTVVTQERGPGTKKRVKIPQVCRERSVDCTNMLGVITSEGWRFR